MRSLSALETKSFLIGFEMELPSPTFNPGTPPFIFVWVSWFTELKPGSVLWPLEGAAFATMPPELSLSLATRNPRGMTGPGMWARHADLREVAR